MMSQKHMDDVNGFSNLYWGWGGEDDDLYMRLWSAGIWVYAGRGGGPPGPGPAHCLIVFEISWILLSPCIIRTLTF